MRRILVVIALLATGCAGARAADRPRSPRSEGVELKSELRRDRRMIHSLENELSLLRARMNDTPMPAPSVREPAAPAPQPAADQAAPLPETLGDAQGDGVEIVYEGEAAAVGGERPRIELHESSRSYAGAGPAERVGGDDGGLDPDPAPSPGAATGDRLPVLAGEIPTVETQMRRARADRAPTAKRSRMVGPPAPVPAAAAHPAPARAHADPEGDYQRYVTAVRGGNHQYAELGLRAFLEEFPRHDLADNAQYWLAESYYDRKQFALALVEFQKVIDRYPRGNKMPDAMLKVAYCRLQRGQAADGLAALRRLVTRFPDTSPAALARAKLEELDSP